MTRAHSYLDHLGHSLHRTVAIQSTHVYIIRSSANRPPSYPLHLYSSTPLLLYTSTLLHPNTPHATVHIPGYSITLPRTDKPHAFLSSDDFLETLTRLPALFPAVYCL